MRLSVRVKPNASAFSATFEEGALVCRVPGKPVDGQANNALLRELKKRGIRARLVAGMRSRSKTLETDASLEELEIALKSGGGRAWSNALA
ncbi:MAG: DUF167 domain-containing protein [Candidatus Micrarchaeia archaeon]